MPTEAIARAKKPLRVRVTAGVNKKTPMPPAPRLEASAFGVLGATALALAFAGAAHAAELNFNPYVAALYQYDSNVYRFSRQVAEVTRTTETADRSKRYTAGLDTGYTWSQQKLSAMAEAREIVFEEFQHLDHGEYVFAGTFDGAILSHTKGLLNYREERRMASFEDRRTTQLIIERERVARGEVNVALTPDWRMVAGARRRNLQSPLPDAPALPQPPPGATARNASPDFAVHETAFKAGLQLGIENVEHPEDEAPLLIGVMLEHQSINFSGVTPQPEPAPGQRRETFEGYRLLSLVATAQYALSGMSSLDAELGATLYNPKLGDTSSRPELTGDIGYIRRFSVLTELNAHLFRRIVPYAATADTTTDTGASIGAKWEPLVDLTVLANYSWATSAFEGLSSVGPENSGRDDQVQNASLSLAYPQMRFFYLRLFGTYSERSSNRAFNDFIDKTVGAELSFRWR